MIIGLMTLEIYLPYSHSLKEKRKTLNKLRDRLKKKHNIAFAELDFQNKWQRSTIGLVTLNTQKRIIEKYRRGNSSKRNPFLLILRAEKSFKRISKLWMRAEGKKESRA
jgi:uncharacterized protein YlxP (DUF503 family)